MYIYAQKERETGYTIWSGLLLHPFPRPVCMCVSVCLLSPAESHWHETCQFDFSDKRMLPPSHAFFFSFPQRFVICFIWFYHVPGFAAIRRPSCSELQLWITCLFFFFLPSVRSTWPYREYVIKISFKSGFGKLRQVSTCLSLETIVQRKFFF